MLDVDSGHDIRVNRAHPWRTSMPTCSEIDTPDQILELLVNAKVIRSNCNRPWKPGVRLRSLGLKSRETIRFVVRNSSLGE